MAAVANGTRFLPWVSTGILGLILLAFGQWIWAVAAFVLFGLGVIDIRQPHQAVRRNYPLTGRLRYALEYIRPEIRQYFWKTTRKNPVFPQPTGLGVSALQDPKR